MTTVAPEPRRSREWPPNAVQRWAGVIIIALSLASVIAVAVQTTKLHDITACQAQYNDAYTRAIEARSLAARNERQAMRELLLTFLGGPITPDQARAAMDLYLKKLDEADLVRDKAQIPSRKC
jgi:hypothetical protein